MDDTANAFASTFTVKGAPDGPLAGLIFYPSNSTIEYWITTTLTVACAMVFRAFPMDEQVR